MAGLTPLAKATFHDALRSVKPNELVKSHLAIDGSHLVVRNGSSHSYDLSRHRTILVLGAGKASQEMCQGLLDIFAKSEAVKSLAVEIKAFVNVPKGQQLLARSAYWPATFSAEFLPASHPLPDEDTVASTNKQLFQLYHTPPDTLLISLISGGGSALFETTTASFAKPSDITPSAALSEVSLADLQSMNKLLISSGASIQDINVVRKHVSQVKGGRLAQHAVSSGHISSVIGLYLSDVVGNDLASVASGPTAADPSTFADAVAVTEKFRFWDKLPPSVSRWLAQGKEDTKASLETPKASDTELFSRVHNVLVGSADTSAAAAEAFLKAQHFNGKIRIFSNQISGESREFGANLPTLIDSLAKERLTLQQNAIYNAAFIATGEFTVTLTGKGVGGRNQEMLLAFILSLLDKGSEVLRDLHFVVVACAFDGIEGNSPATGAFVDSTTISRLEALYGRDALPTKLRKELDNNNSHEIFKILGDAFITGHTGTNVNDMLLILVQSKSPSCVRLE